MVLHYSLSKCLRPWTSFFDRKANQSESQVFSTFCVVYCTCVCCPDRDITYWAVWWCRWVWRWWPQFPGPQLPQPQGWCSLRFRRRDTPSLWWPTCWTTEGCPSPTRSQGPRTPPAPNTPGTAGPDGHSLLRRMKRRDKSPDVADYHIYSYKTVVNNLDGSLMIMIFNIL